MSLLTVAVIGDSIFSCDRKKLAALEPRGQPISIRTAVAVGHRPKQVKRLPTKGNRLYRPPAFAQKRRTSHRYRPCAGFQDPWRAHNI